MEDERPSFAPPWRGRKLLAKSVAMLCSFGLFAVLAVVMQLVLGDRALASEGGLWSAIALRFCSLSASSDPCPASSNSTSTSTSTSLSTR